MLQQAKERMLKDNVQGTDWDEVEKGLIKKWYYTSKIMGTVFEPEFPFFVFDTIAECIMEDPSYKKTEEGEE